MTSASQRLLTYALLGQQVEASKRRFFDQAVEDAYANPAVTEPIEKALADAVIKVAATDEVLVTVTLGSASEWVIAARAMGAMTGEDPVMDDIGLAGTWEFGNGSALCVRCKTESPDAK